ncbi:ABC transporter ATP-binding protein, partial [Mesorhizobium sp. M1E.F.Ca.ET.063.01.1.1]
PRKGGDRTSLPLSSISYVGGRASPTKLPISPLAGEMSGRTEGGVKERGATVPFLITENHSSRSGRIGPRPGQPLDPAEGVAAEARAHLFP